MTAGQVAQSDPILREMIVVRTCGWLLESTSEYVIVTQELHKSGDCRHTINIPRVMIREMNYPIVPGVADGS